jgi:uncharacterized OsmC-like protein
VAVPSAPFFQFVALEFRRGVTQTDRFEPVIDLKGDLTDEQRNYFVEVANKCPVSQTLQRASSVVASLAEMPDQHDARSLA